jgi:hypothetical protein
MPVLEKTITQETIDSIARNLITELADDWVYEQPGEATTQDCAYLTLLEIRGICQMAEALSEVLRE